jgi:type I restriction enzyme S subunit
MNSPTLRFKDGEKSFPDWEAKSLKQIVTRFIVPMRDKPKNLNGSVPWCRIEDFNGRYLNTSKSGQGVSLETIKDMNLKLCPVDTLLVSCSASLGFCSIVKKELVTNQTFIGLVPDFKHVGVEFLYYLMCRSAKKLNQLSSGTTISYLSRENFENFVVKLPSLKEQNQISNFLNAMDEKITHLTQKHELLNQYKKGMMQKIFSQELRFKDVDSAKFSAWVEYKLSEVGEIVSGKTPSTTEDSLWNGDIQFVTPSDIKNKKYQYQTSRTVTKVLKMRVLPEKTIMFTCVASIGKMALSVKPCVTNQQINSLIPKESFDNEFIYYAILNIVDYIKSKRSTSTLPIINKTEFSKFVINIPCLDEQLKIVNLLSAIDEKISHAESQLQLIKQYKQGLLQQMFI